MADIARRADRFRGRVLIARQLGEVIGYFLPEPVFVGFVADPDVEYLQKTDGSWRHY